MGFLGVDFLSVAGLFASAFLAATLIPGSSEAALVLLASRHPDSWPALFLVALAGNTLGALFNYGLGRGFMHFADRRWFPASRLRIEQASQWFNHYGLWVLLLSWLPIVGDPLTVVAGLLRVRLSWFLILVAIGKAARYAIVLAGLQLWQG